MQIVWVIMLAAMACLTQADDETTTTRSSLSPTSTAHAKNTSLSPGADAGIAIAVIIFLLAIGVGICFFIIRRRRLQSRCLPKSQLEAISRREEKNATISTHEVSEDEAFLAPKRTGTMAALTEARGPRRSGTMLDLMASRAASREVSKQEVSP